MTENATPTQITPCEGFEATKLVEEVSVWCTRWLQANPMMAAVALYQDFPQWTIGQLNWALKTLADDKHRQIRYTTIETHGRTGPMVIIGQLYDYGVRTA